MLPIIDGRRNAYDKASDISSRSFKRARVEIESPTDRHLCAGHPDDSLRKSFTQTERSSISCQALVYLQCAQPAAHLVQGVVC